MSTEIACPNCLKPTGQDSVTCKWCGHEIASADRDVHRGEVEDDELESQGAGNQAHGGLHRLAPAVFAGAGAPVGIIFAVMVSPVLAIPVGLMAGGVGVWMVERGRRLRL